jgi:hypothetical protein
MTGFANSQYHGMIAYKGKLIVTCPPAAGIPSKRDRSQSANHTANNTNNILNRKIGIINTQSNINMLSIAGFS